MALRVLLCPPRPCPSLAMAALPPWRGFGAGRSPFGTAVAASWPGLPRPAPPRRAGQPAAAGAAAGAERDSNRGFGRPSPPPPAPRGVSWASSLLSASLAGPQRTPHPPVPPTRRHTPRRPADSSSMSAPTQGESVPKLEPAGGLAPRHPWCGAVASSLKHVVTKELSQEEAQARHAGEATGVIAVVQ